MANNVINSEISNTVIARIDTPDELYVTPLREYLEANGCKVFINEISPDFTSYHIVCGDLDFVKKILANGDSSNTKTLAIVWEGTKREIESLVHTHHIRAWVTKEKNLDSRVTRDIFAFFFTGDSAISVPSGKWESKIHEKNISESSPEQDKARIKTSINAIFGAMPVVKKEKKEEHVLEPKNFYRPVVVLGILIIVSVIPFLWYLLAVSVSGVSLYMGARNMREGNSAKVRFWSTMSLGWQGRARGALSFVSFPIAVTRGNAALLGQEHLLSFYGDIAVSESGIADLLEQGTSVASLLLTQDPEASKSESPAIAVSKLKTTLSTVQNNLGLAQAELTRLLSDRPFPFSIPSVFTKSLRYLSKLSSYHELIGQIDNALALYPEIAGFKEKKTYLVLLQNSMELRPTGGFIGSVALVSFSDGRLQDIIVSDVYALDGQLKGHVDPPGPIRDILHEEHWYLRDSNWDPDFAISGARAAWFYEKETGDTVDGVFAISVPLVTDLLTVTGPLDLPDYNDRITSENFFGKSIFYTQTDFFPGSTQKKDFLGTLTSSLLSKVTTSRTIPQTVLFNVLAKALQSGDILLFFTNKQEEDLVSRFGWAGRVPLTGGCQGVTACVFDPLTVNEANLGINKANYYLQKSMLRQIDVREDGTAQETLTIFYKNTSSNTRPSPGGGPYQAYVRMYLPQESTLEGVSLDGTTVPVRDSKKKTTTEPPYWEKDISNPNVIGIAFAVLPGEEKKLAVSYNRTTLIQFDNNKAVYETTFQKQPGAPDLPLTTDITFPLYWTSRDERGAGTLTFLAKQVKLSYNTTLVKNDGIRIEFTK